MKAMLDGQATSPAIDDMPFWCELDLAQVEAVANGLEPAWQPQGALPLSLTDPGVWHNNPPRLEQTRFAQQIESIVDSDYTSPQKLILLKIRLRCDHRTLMGAFPSYPTLMRAASVKDPRTVKEALRGLIAEDSILTREYRPGRSCSFGISKERLQELITANIERNRAKNTPPSFNVGGTAGAGSSHALRSFLSLKDGENDAVATRSPPPHLNDVGFVISANDGLVVPMQKVQEWRERFPHIPDFEAAMTGLATTLLAKGRAHPGWTCPEGWMVKPLAEMNQEAADKKKITAARVARAGNTSPSTQAPRGKSRRAELDQA
jgi:hypothetical protein